MPAAGQLKIGIPLYKCETSWIGTISHFFLTTITTRWCLVSSFWLYWLSSSSRQSKQQLFSFDILFYCNVLFLLSIFESAIAMNIFICPPEDTMTGCKDPKSCIYPDPNNCNGFIQCNDAGQIFYQNCNQGLEWNDSIKNCEEPQHSTCTRTD